MGGGGLALLAVLGDDLLLQKAEAESREEMEKVCQVYECTNGDDDTRDGSVTITDIPNDESEPQEPTSVQNNEER